jgi:hypothetical protein
LLKRRAGEYSASRERGMRKLVVLLVALLALFTFIRDFPSATPTKTSSASAEIHASLIP